MLPMGVGHAEGEPTACVAMVEQYKTVISFHDHHHFAVTLHRHHHHRHHRHQSTIIIIIINDNMNIIVDFWKPDEHCCDVTTMLHLWHLQCVQSDLEMACHRS